MSEQMWAGDPNQAPWNRHERCECHDCTQVRYKGSLASLGHTGTAPRIPLMQKEYTVICECGKGVRLSMISAGGSTGINVEDLAGKCSCGKSFKLQITTRFRD